VNGAPIDPADLPPPRQLGDDEVDALAAGVVRSWTLRRRAGTALRVAAAAIVVLGAAALLQRPEEAGPTPTLAVTAPPPALIEDDRVISDPGAVFRLDGSHADRVVALTTGHVRCEVARRAPGERFRVVVGEDIVQVTGTRFEVTAEAGRLGAIVVEEGSVELLRPGQAPITLRAGERWPPPVRPAPPPPAAPAGASTEALARGLAQLDAGDPDAAAVTFASPASGGLEEDLSFWRAIALLRAERGSEAEAALRTFIDGWPTSPRAGVARCLLGRALAARGLTEEAQRELAAAAGSPLPSAARCAAEGL
jgi:hypothetical protein